MKKIMFAVMAVALAGVASAASTKWQYQSTAPLKAGYTGNGTSSAAIGSQTLYLFCVQSVSQDSLLTALRGGTDIASAGYVTGGTGTTDSDGKILAKNATVFDSTAFATDQAYNFYSATLITDGSGNKWAYLTASTANITPNDNPDMAKVVAPAASTSSALIDKTTEGKFSAGGWYKISSGAAPIPEPTSAMLLLFGVAGLALRRRHA